MKYENIERANKICSEIRSLVYERQILVRPITIRIQDVDDTPHEILHTEINEDTKGKIAELTRLILVELDNKYWKQITKLEAELETL